MLGFYKIVTAVLLIQTLAMMIEELERNDHEVSFKEMTKISIWTGELPNSKSNQVFFWIDKREDNLLIIKTKIEDILKDVLNIHDGFSEYREIRDASENNFEYKKLKYQQSADNSNNLIVGHGYQLQFYLKEIDKDAELKFQIIERTLNHLMQLYKKNMVIEHFSISNIYVIANTSDIFVAQLKDYTEIKDQLNTFNHQMKVVLEMASQIFPAVIKEIKEGVFSSNKSKRINCWNSWSFGL